MTLRVLASADIMSHSTCMPRESREMPASLNSLSEWYQTSVRISNPLTITNLSFFISTEVGLASRLISASQLKCTELATALITDSTVAGFIKLGVPTVIIIMQ